MSYSLTVVGVIVSVVGTSLVQFGFSEGCANEIAATLPVVIGGILSWYGRVRQGDITVAGFRK